MMLYIYIDSPEIMQISVHLLKFLAEPGIVQLIYTHRLIHNQNTQLSLKAVSVHYYILLQYYSSSTLLYIHTFHTFRTLRFFDVSNAANACLFHFFRTVTPLLKKGNNE